eukprot:5624033-Amphidinium_carterae.1
MRELGEWILDSLVKPICLVLHGGDPYFHGVPSRGLVPKAHRAHTHCTVINRLFLAWIIVACLEGHWAQLGGMAWGTYDLGPSASVEVATDPTSMH